MKYKRKFLFLNINKKIGGFNDYVLMDEAGGGSASGGDGDGGSDDGEKNFSKADVDAAIAAAVKTATDGLTKKNTELLDDLKKTKTSLKAFEGIDPETTRKMIQQFENNQDLKDIAEGKHEEVFSRRSEKLRAEYDSQIQSLEEKYTEKENESNKYKSRFEELSIDNRAIDLFVKNKGHESALEDIRLRARQVWRLEGDDIVPRDSQGKLLTGANGQMSMEEWIVSLKKTSPHLFPSSSGPESMGSGASDNFTISEKLSAALKNNDMAEYKRLRKEQLSKKR